MSSVPKSVNALRLFIEGVVESICTIFSKSMCPLSLLPIKLNEKIK